MNEEQKRLYDLLVRFDIFTKKHNIEYYLDGGTLIGAVRNRGFLPWDDDVDTIMTRKNFEKLLLVADQLHDQGLDLACYERYNEYSKNSVKLIDLTTTMILYGDILHDKSAGVQVDIFIMDPVPKAKVEFFSAHFSVYTELLSYNFLVNKQVDNYRSTYYKYYYLMRLIGRDNTLKILRKKIFNFSEEDSDYYIMRFNEAALFYEKTILQKPQFLSFEGRNFPVPTRTEDFLRMQYGDDWKIVPNEDAQLTHSDVRDYNLSANNYFSDFYRFIDVQDAKRIMKKRKTAAIKKIRYESDLKVIENFLEEINYLDTFKVPQELYTLFEQKQFDEIKKITEAIVGDILKMVRRGYAPQIKGDFYRIVLYTLIASDQYYTAQKILPYVSDNILDKKTKMRYQSLIDLNREIDKCLDNCELDKAMSIAEQNIESHSDNLTFTKTIIYVELQSEHPDFARIDACYQRAIKSFPEDGELLKLQGDLLLKKGDAKAAIECYNEAKIKTRNGVVLLDLQDKLH